MKSWCLKDILMVATLCPALSGMAWAAVDTDSCSSATLTGDYAFTTTGQARNSDGTIGPLSWVIGMIKFDGAGNLTQVDFPANGTVTLGLTDFRTGQTGTYTVNPDCTGKAEIDLNIHVPQGSSGVIHLMFALSNHGRAIRAVVSEIISPGATQPSLGQIRVDFWKLGPVNDERAKRAPRR
jgi:hypothetical protein